MVQCMVMAAMDDTCQCTQQWMHKSVFKKTITTRNVLQHIVQSAGAVS